MQTCKLSLQVGACLALAACAGRAPPPAINDKVVTVHVPVAVRCIDPARVPAPVPATDINGDAKHDASVMAQTILTLRSAVDQLMALAGPCVVTPAPTTSTPAQ
jgi:hypothetical protein